MPRVKYQDVLKILTNNLRILTAEQIGRHWFSHTVAPTKMASQFIARQCRDGLLTRQESLIHPPLYIEAHIPLVDWQPGTTEEPNWDKISWAIESRWNQPVTRAVIVWATKKARTNTGGQIGGRPPRPLEISHDVTLGELFLQMRKENRAIDEQWTPEDVLVDYGTGEKKPDAILRSGTDEVLIELGGKSYSAKKLREIHQAHRHRRYRLY